MTRTHWQSIACALAAILAATPAAAQRATLRGQVIDAASGQPVAAAVIEVMPRRDRAVTDAQGRFTLRTTLGDHVIMADALGYGSAVQPVTIGDPEVEVQIGLDQDPVLLQGIVATASRLQSRRRAYPHAVRSLSAPQIAASAAPNMEMLVRERLGVFFTSCGGYGRSGALGARTAHNAWYGGFARCIYSRGGTVPTRVYIDEVRMSDASALALYNPREVAEVEVYQNGAQIRVYTRWFMEWAARNNYSPLPLGVASF
jgi:hypothetical protein